MDKKELVKSTIADLLLVDIISSNDLMKIAGLLGPLTHYDLENSDFLDLDNFSKEHRISVFECAKKTSIFSNGDIQDILYFDCHFIQNLLVDIASEIDYRAIDCGIMNDEIKRAKDNSIALLKVVEKSL